MFSACALSRAFSPPLRLCLLARLLALVKLAALPVLLHSQCLPPLILTGLDIARACGQFLAGGFVGAAAPSRNSRCKRF